MSAAGVRSNGLVSEADFARAQGWGPGTRLAGDDGHGETVIEITAIGFDCVLARPVSRRGGSVREDEGTWTFSCRDWRVVQ